LGRDAIQRAREDEVRTLQPALATHGERANRVSLPVVPDSPRPDRDEATHEQRGRDDPARDLRWNDSRPRLTRPHGAHAIETLPGEPHLPRTSGAASRGIRSLRICSSPKTGLVPTLGPGRKQKRDADDQSACWESADFRAYDFGPAATQLYVSSESGPMQLGAGNGAGNSSPPSRLCRSAGVADGRWRASPAVVHGLVACTMLATSLAWPTAPHDVDLAGGDPG
jgi:hypothetical protein